MGIFPWSWFSGRQTRKQPITRSAVDGRRLRPAVEALEDRSLPSCATISGFVYQDANHNGLFDVGELPIANSTIQLRDVNNLVVATTTTNSSGFYAFDHDPRISQVPQTLTQTITFPEGETDFSLQDTINQFDPALGQLQSVTINHQGFITSEIKVENTSTKSTSTIKATVGGTLTLTGGNTSLVLTPSGNAGTFAATKFDGVNDFGGTSGKSFAPQTINATKEIILTGSGINPFIGTGLVTFTENVEAASSAIGGGNLQTEILSSAGGAVTVTYAYIPSNCLKPGNYTIVQVSQPPGFLDGQESRNGTILNNPHGVSVIPVTLNGSDLPNNNFGELKPASLSGYVYVDANADGVKTLGEAGIANVQITLLGSNYLGTSITLTTTTNASGFYQFNNLLPGTYEVREKQPANYLDGQDAIGSQGGFVENDRLYDALLATGVNGTDNNFGELAPASLSGYVYVDGNDNGIKETGEAGLGGVLITLGGTDYLGNPVTATTTTASNGFYQFTNLLPGTYILTEKHPANYLDGQDTVGTQGGITNDDQFSDILLAAGVNGINNNFGEISPDQADLAIVKTANPASVIVGGQVQFTLTVSNLGTHTAKAVIVSDVLPSNAIYVAAYAPNWATSVVGQTLTFSRPTLAVGETVTITITIKAPLVAGTLPNTATVTSQTPDPNPQNNTSTTTVVVYNQPGQGFPRTVTPLALGNVRIPFIDKQQAIYGLVKGLHPDLVRKFAWIGGAYQTLLGRAPTNAELFKVRNQLDAGITREQITNALWNSYEHRVLQVNNFYQVFLRRAPSTAEKQLVIGWLNAGMSETQLAVGFLTSPEYRNAHPTSTALVAGFYQDLQGVVPDLATLQSKALVLDTMDVRSFALSMLNSQPTLAYLVDSCYRTALRRAANNAEIQYWVTRLQSQQITPGGLVRKLLASDSFVSLAVASIKT